MRTLCSALAVLWVAMLLGGAPSEAAVRSQVKPMALYSTVLKRQMNYSIYLPKHYLSFRRFPVIYFLHGLNGNQDDWSRYGCREALDELIDATMAVQLAVVMPEGDSGFFMNSADGTQRYADYLIQDVIPHVESHWRVGAPGGWVEGASAEFRAISGVSTGGCAALALALRNPGLFRSVSAHAPFLATEPPERFAQALRSSAFMEPIRQVFGWPTDMGTWEYNNPIALAGVRQNIDGLDIFFDCGRDDPYGFAQGAMELDRVLKQRNVRHVFSMQEGGHDWEYFARRIPESLKFHSLSFARAARRAGS